MAKKKIRPGQIYKHVPTGGSYEVVSKCKIKIPHVGWFKGVNYRDAEGKMYSRFLEDFENKFVHDKTEQVDAFLLKNRKAPEAVTVNQE